MSNSGFPRAQYVIPRPLPSIPWSTILRNSRRGYRHVHCALRLRAEQGFVLVPRETVSHPVGDVELIFAGSIRVKGNIYFMHPCHNYAIVRFDRSVVDDPSKHQICPQTHVTYYWPQPFAGHNKEYCSCYQPASRTHGHWCAMLSAKKL
jgi:hypothetical protein